MSHRLQPNKGPSETVILEGAGYYVVSLQPNKGPSETYVGDETHLRLDRFNPTRVLLKPIVADSSPSTVSELQPNKGPSETKHCHHQEGDGQLLQPNKGPSETDLLDTEIEEDQHASTQQGSF